ncbi:ATP-binding protein [Larkinella humicola]|uniref:Histidine kinase/DNA gyrase B/HSP90-like ATPase n=1 Tax=Larkinella humicola TaxID=2607654 RepID=A0A5N1JGG2_9BACT|nr:ATP-binding protein [Larkinella humicola]KAA9349720.1 hypothetical protein F0P93_19915 [Larkinella humicola]
MSNFIQVDLENWIRSIKLKESQFLFPLYEVVINAIQAIHERNTNEGRIDIFIRRKLINQLTIIGSDDSLGEIIGFEVIDNGVGFNEENRNSFGIAYTGHKAKLGCKGIGRFLSLAMFNRIEVDSTYLGPNILHFQRRSFHFDAINKIHKENVIDTKDREYKTLVKLIGIRDQFKKTTHASTIANNLLHHCLIYFISGNQPFISIIDESVNELIELNSLFYDSFKIEDNEENVKIKNETFRINYVKNYIKVGSAHKIHYCGDSREVDTEGLSRYIPVLEKKISDQNGNYFISVYVNSPYLDRNLTPLRDEFIIPKSEKDKDAFNLVSFPEIGEEISKKVKQQFSDEIDDLTNIHREKYRNYIFEQGLEYRHLLQDESILDTLRPGNTDKEKDLELHKLNFDLEHKQRIKVDQFLNIKDIKNSEEYKELLKDIIKDENKIGESKLINYMLHRKTVLKVLGKFIEIQEDGEFKFEAEIHDIIFLRDKTNDQIAFNKHNLWILDERVAYTKYIASDKRLKETDFLYSESDKKPDLLIYDNKFVYGEGNSSIVIFEFKRPMRSYYTQEEKNVGNQIKKYIKDLMLGKALDYRGRIANINKDTPKFGYIICDYNNDIYNELDLEGYKRTPKGTLFKYEEGLNLFIEVMNYEQLLEDANMRHRAFFSMLGITGI